MTPKERVLKALHGGHTDRVPFTMYENKIPRCAAEREMRNRGLCIVRRDVGVYRTHRPNVKVTQNVYQENGRKLTRTFYETPVGTLTTLVEAAGFTSWKHETMFKSPDDYKAMLFLIQDEQYAPAYEAFTRAEREDGEDVILRAGISHEPMQALLSSSLMKPEDWCLQWMDNRDEVLKLYDALVENCRKLYPIIAKSPALHANYGGNVVHEIIGREVFEKYYVPHYDEAAEVMHKHGKLIGCHYDDDCGPLAEAIAKTGLDYIEAFTPAPTTDMTLAQARAAWPDKVLWLNFPSDRHLRPDAEVERITVELLNELESVDGIIMGITEDVPEHRWQGSCKAIMDGLERHAREKPQMYA